MAKVAVDLKHFFSQGHFWAQFPNTKEDDHYNSAIDYFEKIYGECSECGGTEAEFIFCHKDTKEITAKFFLYDIEFENAFWEKKVILTKGNLVWNAKFECPVYVITSVEEVN